jgi:hypothetical protein
MPLSLPACVLLNSQLFRRKSRTNHFANSVAGIEVLDIRRDAAATSPSAEMGVLPNQWSLGEITFRALHYDRSVPVLYAPSIQPFFWIEYAEQNRNLWHIYTGLNLRTFRMKMILINRDKIWDILHVHDVSLSVFPVAATLTHTASVKRVVSLQFLYPKAVGRTPWTGNQPVARLLSTQTHTSVPLLRFEATIPAFGLTCLRLRRHCNGLTCL